MDVKPEKFIPYRNRYPDVVLGIRRDTEMILLEPLWKVIYLRIKYALQRAVRGYDDTAIVSLDDYIQSIIIRGLLHLADLRFGVPVFDNDDESLSLEERLVLWKEKLAEIADHFYESIRYADKK